MQEKIFKFLFPSKNSEIYFSNKIISNLDGEIMELKEKLKNKKESVFSIIDFVNVDEKGMPPHPFKTLKEEDKKNYVFSLDQIYSDPKFKEMSDYMINYLGNHAIRGESEQGRHNAGIAILAINNFIKLFEDAHNNAEEIRNTNPEFDQDEAYEII